MCTPSHSISAIRTSVASVPKAQPRTALRTSAVGARSSEESSRVTEGKKQEARATQVLEGKGGLCTPVGVRGPLLFPYVPTHATGWDCSCSHQPCRSSCPSQPEPLLRAGYTPFRAPQLPLSGQEELIWEHGTRQSQHCSLSPSAFPTWLGFGFCFVFSSQFCDAVNKSWLPFFSVHTSNLISSQPSPFSVHLYVGLAWV